MSSFVEPVSATTTGESFIGFTVISNLAVVVNTPSVIVYVAWGTAPLKLFAGVNT